MNRVTNNVRRLLSLFPLYGILTPSIKNFSMREQTQKMLSSGVKIIQYRNKDKTIKDKLNEINEIKKLFIPYDALFIINDDIDLCLLSDADGVHLGQTDTSVFEAKEKLAPSKVIGLSTHAESQALQAIDYPINYIGVGPVFPTSTKPEKQAVGLNYVKFCSNLNIPKIAIGGITASNCHEVFQGGIKNICSISNLLNKKDEYEEKIQIIYKKWANQY